MTGKRIFTNVHGLLCDQFATCRNFSEHSESVTIDEDLCQTLEDTIFRFMAGTDPTRPNSTYQKITNNSLTVFIYILQVFFSLLVELFFSEEANAMRIGNSSA